MLRNAQSQDDDPYDYDDTDRTPMTPLSGISLPDLGSVDMNQMPMFETQQQNSQVSFATELTNRCGIAYFSGLIASGVYGGCRGYQIASKSMPMRLKLNSMLNHGMKLGANNGNMFAVLALYFVSIKRTIPKLSPVDIHPDLNLVISGAAAGSIYKGFHPMRTIARFGGAGAIIPSFYVGFKWLMEEGMI